MSTILTYTIVLVVSAMQHDYFVTITKSSDDPEDSRLELTLRNGSFRQALIQDLLGTSKMEILYPQGEVYRVNLFFELSEDQVSKGMPNVLYLRSKSVPNEAGNVTRVITLTKDRSEATPFTARVIGSTSKRKVSLFILSAVDNTTYMGALPPGLTDENLPLIREVTKQESPHRLYQGVVARYIRCSP